MAWIENVTAFPGRTSFWLIGWDVTLGGLAAKINDKDHWTYCKSVALVIHCSWFGYILQIDNSYLLKSIQTVVSQYYNIVVNETRDQYNKSYLMISSAGSTNGAYVLFFYNVVAKWLL